MVYFGEYVQTLDDKSRMRLPMKLRVLLGQHYYMLYGAEGSIVVMDGDRFEAMTQKFATVPMTDVKARGAISDIMASVISPEEDSQGRFVLPLKLREYAGIEKKAVVIGACDYIEIWSEEKYSRRQEAQSESVTDKLKSLREYGV